jgi:hypothetical protein
MQQLAETLAYFGISGATLTGIVIAVIMAVIKKRLADTELDELLQGKAENYARRLESFDKETYEYLETFVRGAWDKVSTDKELHDTVKDSARKLINSKLPDYGLSGYEITEGWLDEMIGAIANETRERSFLVPLNE